MLGTIFGFLYKYLFDAVIVFVVGMLSKSLIKEFGKDRADNIQDAISVAMLWAEEKIGIGNGNEKFKIAWDKIIELLSTQGIKLKENEISTVQTMMKANIPEINAITYGSLPEELKLARDINYGGNEIKKVIEKLKLKYPEEKE